MHTMELFGGWRVHHNGDFSGDVEITAPGTPTQVMVVPMLVLQCVVAEQLRRERIAALEDAGPLDIIGQRFPVS